MKHLLSIYLFMLYCTTAGAQSMADNYSRAVTALQHYRLDSSAYYLSTARAYYSAQHNFDSLALTLALQALVTWEQKTAAETMPGVDAAMQLVLRKLPSKSAGRIALNSIKGSLYSSRYQFDSASIYYNRALRAADSVRPQLPLVTLYMNLCRMETQKENAVKAEFYYRKAYATLQAVNPHDELTLTDLLITETQYLIAAGKYNEAMEPALHAERLILKNYRENNPKVAKNYGNLSVICYYLTRYEEALLYRQKALKVYLQSNREDINHSTAFYATYYNMGQLYYYLSEHSLASTYLRRALAIGTNIYGRENAGMINILIQFATCQQKLQKFDLAQAYFEEAYRTQIKIDPRDYSTLAYIESFYGDLFLDKKNYDSAAYYYHAALAHYHQIKEDLSYYALFTKMNLAIAQGVTGHTAKALMMQKDVLNKFRIKFPFLKLVAVEFLGNIAETYLKANKPDSARLYADSCILLQTGLKALSANPNEWMHKLPFSFKVLEQIKTRLDILYQKYQQSKQKQYLVTLLKTAEAYSDYISANVYQLRTQHSLTEQSALNKAIFSRGIEACWDLSNTENKQLYLEKAFMFAEQGKALLLRLASNSFMIDNAMGQGDATVKQDIQLRKEISRLNEQYLNAESNADSLFLTMTAAIETYRNFQDKLKKTGNSYFNKRYALTASSPAEIRKELLKGKATLIEYALAENHLYVFVISKDSFYARRTDADFSGAIKVLQNPQNLSVQRFRDSAFKLYTDLIQPVERYFTSSNLIIVPDADLYYLNFETLLTDRLKNNFSSLSYLINRYTISYLLSTDAAIQLKKYGYNQQDKTNDKALLFAPVFTDGMKQLYKKQVDALQDDSSYLRLFRQPFALQAAKNIHSFISADMFLEQQAQESAFKQNSPVYKILHLSTHAQVNDQDPLQSRLFFARSDTNISAADDGNLYAYEIYAMHLKADLAVLTACETGTGAAHSGEGVMSLAHSFMFAGCPSVIMSLWKIDEQTNAVIITDFYRHLKNGDNKSDALRKAKLDFIKHNPGELSNPFYWAGLCVIGDDTPLYPGKYRLYLVIPIAAIGILLFFILSRYRVFRKN